MSSLTVMENGCKSETFCSYNSSVSSEKTQTFPWTTAKTSLVILMRGASVSAQIHYPSNVSTINKKMGRARGSKLLTLMKKTAKCARLHWKCYLSLKRNTDVTSCNFNDYVSLFDYRVATWPLAEITQHLLQTNLISHDAMWEMSRCDCSGAN